MKRKEKAAVDEFVALVGGKTWEPVRHKCMGKWSGMTDYGFVIDGRITLFVSNIKIFFRLGHHCGKLFIRKGFRWNVIIEVVSCAA